MVEIGTPLVLSGNSNLASKIDSANFEIEAIKASTGELNIKVDMIRNSPAEIK